MEIDCDASYAGGAGERTDPACRKPTYLSQDFDSNNPWPIARLHISMSRLREGAPLLIESRESCAR